MKDHSKNIPFIPSLIFFDPDVSHFEVRIYGVLFIFDSKTNNRKRRAMIMSKAMDYDKDLDVSSKAIVAISHGKLAKYLNCSKRSIEEGLKNLYETGWINIISCPGRSNFYVLNIDPKRAKLTQNLAV